MCPTWSTESAPTSAASADALVVRQLVGVQADREPGGPAGVGQPPHVVGGVGGTVDEDVEAVARPSAATVRDHDPTISSK